MKIILATESFYPNIDGGAVAQFNLTKELVKKGHEVHVIAPNSNFKNMVEKKDGIIIHRVRAIKLPFYMQGRYYFSPFPYLKINSIIRKVKPDVINVCSPYFIGSSAYISARRNRLPVVGSIHLLPQNLISPIRGLRNIRLFEIFFWKYLIYFFDFVDIATIPTETGAKIYKNKGLKTKVVPISNGINTDIFNPKNNGEYLRKKFNLPKKNIVLCCGRLTAEKNLDVLVKAIPYVIKEKKAHFLFVGSGGDYKKYLINLSNELKVKDHITFTDFLDWKDYPNIFTIADLFVMPSEAELQSIVSLEAVASGLPVVVVNKGALPELVSMDNGLIFDSKNSEQMADHIIKILSDKKLQRQMGENSLKLVKNHTLETVTIQFENVYKKTIDVHKK